MRVGVGYGVSGGQRYYIIYINIKIYNKSLACCLKRGLNVLIRQNDDSRERHFAKNLQRHFISDFTRENSNNCRQSNLENRLV